MADVVLLRLQTDVLTFELRGSRTHRLGAVSGAPATAARVKVAGLQPGDEVTSETEPGVWANLLIDDASAPRLFEDTRYRLTVTSTSGPPPNLRVRDLTLLSEVDRYADRGMLAGPINFGRQVGLADFDLEALGRQIRLTIEVFPTKLDYAADYQTILHDVANAGRALGLEYLRSTYTRGGTRTIDEPNTDLEWLLLVRQEVEGLERALAFVDAHPHRGLVVAEASIRIDRIRRADAAVRRAASRGAGQGPWVLVPGLGAVHERLPSTVRSETLDTAEHRWLRLGVQVLVDRLGMVHADLTEEIRAARNRGSSIDRLVLEAEEVEGLILRVSRLMSLPVLVEATGPVPFGFTSLRLLSAPGYGEAYRAITVLRLGLHIDGDLLDLSVKDLSALYEAWCFISIARQLCVAMGEISNATAVVVAERGLRINLVQGKGSLLKFVAGERSVTLSYNPTYKGLTGEHRPDIVIEVRHPTWPAMFVVLDAKYRLSADEKYVARFGLPGPPADAVNALHRYRDAIVLESADQGLERPVVMGAALYPLRAEESQGWPESRLCAALETLGIGAIPYLPANTDFVAAWITYLLALPPAVLAIPGPPFAALEALRARTP